MQEDFPIVNDRIKDFINSLSPDNEQTLEDIREKAVSEYVPILKRETESLLKTLVRMKSPKKILEIGSAVGYSALIMAGCMPEGSSITTIESFEKRVTEANENFKNSPYADRIKLIPGDALSVLDGLDGGFDFVFIDAAKGQYSEFFKKVLKQCVPGAVILTDNVLQDGTIVESRYLIEQRDRTIHSRMRDFLYDITHREDVVTSILSVGDGVALSVVK